MPSVAYLRAKADQEGGGKALDPASIDLLLPSQIIGHAKCNQRLFQFEWHPRFAQAHDPLNDICRLLVLWSRLHQSKERFAHGQSHNTCSLAVLNHVNAKIQYGARKYWNTCSLLEQLEQKVLVVSWDQQLQLLHDKDIWPLSEGDGSGTTEGRHVLLWIWRVQGNVNTEETTQEGMPCLSHFLYHHLPMYHKHCTLNGARLVPEPIGGRKNVYC